jgi:hypothetical protein
MLIGDWCKVLASVAVLVVVAAGQHDHHHVVHFGGNQMNESECAVSHFTV